MNAAIPATPRPPADFWRASARQIGIACLIWALASTILYFLAPGIETFPRLLLFSECSGTAITIIFILLRRLRWFRSNTTLIDWVVTGVIAIPTGFVVGHVIAFLILDEPMRLLQPGHFTLVPVLFTVLVAACALYYFAMQERLAKEAAVRSAAQLLAAESQLRMLRAQLEPHMLFNTLANLRSLLNEDPRQAEVMIDRLIVYLRSALAASRSESTTLAGEFTQLRAYLDIMSIRMGPRLSFRLELPANLEATPIPPMLLQPLVENAIKHGIEPKVGTGSIEVLARRGDAGIEIMVNDSGLGLAPDSGTAERPEGAGGSYGLVHVRERLKAVYGTAASMQIKPRSPNGVCVTVTIPG
ncbi:MAG: histidine kinase [Betaproteobacteria bacterium]